LLAVGAAPGAGQEQPAPFTGAECLAPTKDGVNIEDCFEEYLRRSPNDKEGWRRFLMAHRSALWYDQVDRLFRIRRNRPPEIPLAAPKARTAERSLAIRGSAQYREVPYLSSGGFLNVITFRPFLDGHFDVMVQILGNRERDAARFERAGLLIAADAAQDPDFYAWLQDPAHAQTPSGDDAKISDAADRQNGAAAKINFVKWLGDRLRQLHDLCANPQTTHHAIYMLGYTLHSIQDLAAHNGRTAAEHSWNSYCFGGSCDGRAPDESDPDEIADHIAVAREFSKILVTHVRQRLLSRSCWTAMRDYKGAPVTGPTKVELTKAKMKGWDLSFSEIQRYKRAGPAFAKLDRVDQIKVRWLGTIAWENATETQRIELRRRFVDEVVEPALAHAVRQ
jgi:hypothetical protein